MVERVLGTHEMRVTEEHDVVLVRRKVRELAEHHGFDVFAAAAITTATSELSRNLWTHGGGGGVTIEEIERDRRRGLRLCFRDDGPGIGDVDRALSGGFSTKRSLGLGLSGSRRLVDEFDLATEVGHGTTVRVTKWTRFHTP
jgi:serine/threonine-protein kinase RsbT